MNPRRSARRRSNAPGMSLVEMVVSILLVGVMLVGAMRMVGASRLGERVLADRDLAHELADDLMGEILTHGYADEADLGTIRAQVFTNASPVAVTLGSESGESGRADFDDIDDYAGWSASPPQGPDGIPIAGLGGWGRTVEVELVRVGDTGAVATLDEGARRITVTVSRNGVPLVEHVSLRTLDSPPQVACVFADDSCIDLPAGVCAAAGGISQGDGTSCFNDGPIYASLAAPPSVLLVVNDPVYLTTEEDERKDLIESWGMTVGLIDVHDPQSSFDSATAQHNVAYISEEIDSNDLGVKLVNATIGVVWEEANLADEFGMASTIKWKSGHSVDVVENIHQITQTFSLCEVSIFHASDSIPVLAFWSPDLLVLAEFANEPALAALEAGDRTITDVPAAGRRVHLPWAGNTFELDSLAIDGRTMMQRALEWAAGFESSVLASGSVVVNSHRFGSGTSTSLTIDTPTCTMSGDLLVAAVATDDNTTSSLHAQAGWNLLVIEERYDQVTFGVWWKIAGASEPGHHTFGWAGEEDAVGWILRLTGHDVSNPINDWAVLTTGSGVTYYPPCPEVTTSVDNALILRLGGFDDDDITHGVTGLAGHVEILMADSGNGSKTCSGGVGYALQPIAGNSAPATFTLTEQEQAVTVTIAIAPDPTEGGE